MKTEQRTIQITAYRDDDGKPICGGCKLQAPNGLCQYSKAEAGYYPSSSCPVWHGESKPALVIELLEKISRVAHGEDQVGDNDTEGMEWIAEYVDAHINSLSPKENNHE